MGGWNRAGRRDGEAAELMGQAYGTGEGVVGKLTGDVDGAGTQEL